jgi:hypothetical protein
MKKKSPSKKTKKPSNLTIIGAVFVALIAVFLSWNLYVHFQDKQKFMTLKQDMLTLQTEFNKIDPGWMYSEWCHAKGEKFKENEVSSCGISLKTTRDINLEKYNVLEDSKNIFVIGPTEIIKDDIHNRTFNNKGVYYKPLFNCIFSGEKIDAVNTDEVNVSCSSSALEFYFPKTQ